MPDDLQGILETMTEGLQGSADLHKQSGEGIQLCFQMIRTLAERIGYLEQRVKQLEAR